MKILNLFGPKKVLWDYRLVSFKDHNAADENAYYVKVVEVYYRNGIPHTWQDPIEIVVDNYDNDDVVDLYEKEFSIYVQGIADALDKPILYESDFE